MCKNASHSTLEICALYALQCIHIILQSSVKKNIPHCFIYHITGWLHLCSSLHAGTQVHGLVCTWNAVDAGLQGRHMSHTLPLAVSALGRTPPLPTCPWLSPSSTAIRRTILLWGRKSEVLVRRQPLHQGCSANSCCCIRAERKVRMCKDACVLRTKQFRNTPKKLEANHNYELRNRYTTNRWAMKLVKKEVGPKHFFDNMTQV